ncbi:MAG: Omp28-related outer membrane protein [Bacteroidales bacterium]|nr:Omp28-related outer membrane protein [Bacteroidales bacterium]
MKKIIITFIYLSTITAFTACKEDPPNNPEDPNPNDETIFVSKTATNRNVLLEDFTGINCLFCPDGHKIADEISALYPDDFFHINIHAGNFARDTFTTTEGTALDNVFNKKYNSSGALFKAYPQACINRELIKETDTADAAYVASRMYWNGIVTQLLNEPSYVNVAAKTSINKSTRKLTCKVQAYFTADSEVDEGKNYINIALTQSNIWGPQKYGETFYPAMYDAASGLYKHNHMLRAYITSLLGESMQKNTSATFYEKTFTYDIPAKINIADVVLEDVNVIVFVTENTYLDAATSGTRIVTACESSITFE